jgi:antitoxin ChpS
MYSTNLRRVGGSIMLAVPAAILDLLSLDADARVELAVEGECLVVHPRPGPRYTMDELLEQCDASAPVSDEDAAWIGLAPVGREL